MITTFAIDLDTGRLHDVEALMGRDALEFIMVSITARGFGVRSMNTDFDHAQDVGRTTFDVIRNDNSEVRVEVAWRRDNNRMTVSNLVLAAIIDPATVANQIYTVGVKLTDLPMIVAMEYDNSLSQSFANSMQKTISQLPHMSGAALDQYAQVMGLQRKPG